MKHMTTIHVLEKKSLHTTVQNYRQIAIIISVRCESRTAGGEHGSSAAARVRGVEQKTLRNHFSPIRFPKGTATLTSAAQPCRRRGTNKKNTSLASPYPHPAGRPANPHTTHRSRVRHTLARTPTCLLFLHVHPSQGTTATSIAHGQHSTHRVRPAS
jgi:hypothetical protein